MPGYWMLAAIPSVYVQDTSNACGAVNMTKHDSSHRASHGGKLSMECLVGPEAACPWSVWWAAGFEEADTVTTEIPAISMEVDRWVLNALSVTVAPR